MPSMDTHEQPVACSGDLVPIHVLDASEKRNNGITCDNDKSCAEVTLCTDD